MELIALITLIGIIIILLRLLGAWMLRINDVIKELKQIKSFLKEVKDFQQREY
jgi:uncharacterized membrane protein YbhN (UPF0104 family)